jgi:Spy/CpxP family protein refolding chaperone
MELREDISSERQKLADLMKTDDSTSILRSQHQKIIDLDQKMHNLRFEVMLEMREVLTMEQRQQWAESMQELKANRRARFLKNQGEN